LPVPPAPTRQTGSYGTMCPTMLSRKAAGARTLQPAPVHPGWRLGPAPGTLFVDPGARPTVESWRRPERPNLDQQGRVGV